MSAVRRGVRLISIGARLTVGAVAVTRLARAAAVAAPVRPTLTPMQSISVVIPARDEAGRIGPLLDVIVGAPGVDEVIVVDDQSSDGTADIARRTSATVLSGAALPDGWAGKAWALEQGIAAATSEWVVTLDADTRPDPRLPAALVARAAGERLDFLSVGGRFDCPTAGSRFLHPAMLTTLVYRFGPPGVSATRPDRIMANGQCTVFERDRFRAAGGMESVCGEVVEDVALGSAPRHTGAAGRLPRCQRAVERAHVRVVPGRPRRMGSLAGAARCGAAPAPTRRPRRGGARPGAPAATAADAPRRHRRRWVAGATARHPRRHPPRLPAHGRRGTGRARSPIRSRPPRSLAASHVAGARSGGGAATPDGVAPGDRRGPPWRIEVR